MHSWVVAEAAFEVSSLLSVDAARALTEAIEQAAPGAPIRHAIRSHVPPEAGPLVQSLLDSCNGSVEAFSASLAAAVVARSRVEAEAGSTQIVWTGPATVPVPDHRPTSAVAHEVIASAKEHLTLATFSAGKVDDIIDALDRRRREGIEIRLLVETLRSDGEGPDCPKAFERLIPYVNALEWPRKLRKDHDWTSMHVKVLIKDSDAALVTSANISRSAMRDNMELGVMIEGGLVPARLRQHFDDLETAELLVGLT